MPFHCGPNHEFLDLRGLDAFVDGLGLILLAILGGIVWGVAAWMRRKRAAPSSMPRWLVRHGLGVLAALAVGAGLAFAGQCTSPAMREIADRQVLGVAVGVLVLWFGSVAMGIWQDRAASAT